MQPQSYLLFDAGGTLVFPNQSFLIEEAREYGLKLTSKQLFDGYYWVMYTLDEKARGGEAPPSFLAEQYAHYLFQTLGMVNSATQVVAQAFQDRHYKRNLWAFTFEWVHKTLSRLAMQGYRMSVISNSDGRTHEVFDDLGLAGYFERIFDSKNLGEKYKRIIEKPDPAIFELALSELNLEATDALYIGDLFEVDVRGANRAGVGAVHLDPLSLYVGWPGEHLPDIRHLPGWLECYAADPAAFDLFPLRDSSRQPELQKAQSPANGSGNLCPIVSETQPAFGPQPGPWATDALSCKLT